MTSQASTPTLDLARELIRLPSVTPNDADCQSWLAARLRPLGFRCETLESGPDDWRVRNLWALRQGSGGADAPVLVFAGHTDVVPTGPLQAWSSDPFEPTLRDGRLYGRGAADMKSSLAAMVVAVEQFLRAHPDPRASIGFVLTSDEEGPARDGTVRVCEALRERGQRLDWCIVGEPTCVDTLGDTIKNGRRGSLTGRLLVHGVQGHVAYPHLARNPVHLAAPALAELAATVWDEGDEHFPPTTWQVSNIHAGTGATNVIPGDLEVVFNFRFSPASPAPELQRRVVELLQRHGLQHTLEWTLGAEPFLTPAGELSRALVQAIADETGVRAELSTTGGTSDARFLAKVCAQVVEFGPPNASIHKIDEHIELRFLEPLAGVYRRTLEALVA
ncbi:MAG: succinyl-diaminopimelate desuccinylase [Betaproteobacteria bacterium]|nr:succinyl-diaminopimelate desuccinylase [Betaproteobacteria bacterium]